MTARDVVALLATFAGAVHLSIALSAAGHDHAHGTAWLDAAFVVAGVLLCAAGAAARWTTRPAKLIAGAVAGSYVLSRVTGLPGHPVEAWDSIGLIVTTSEVATVLAGVRLRPNRIKRRTKAAIAAGIVAASGLHAVAWATEEVPAHAAACAAPREVSLEAVQLEGTGLDGGPRLAYRERGASAPAATPAPLIEMIEGECLAITLKNSVPRETLAALRTSKSHPLGVSLHVHGVKYTQGSDGTIGSNSYVPPGESRTYIWYAAPRTTVAGRVTSLGTAGYWWYHDHVVGTSHGTAGVNAGLWGGLIVRRAGDVKPDRTYVVGMGGPAPIIQVGEAPRNTPGREGIVAKQGELVEFLVIGVPGRTAPQDFHEFHLHGHNWADNRTGLLVGPGDETRVIDAKVIGPSESFGFQVRAGEDVGPGHWMLHCHVQEHSDAGMSTFFRVDGSAVATATEGAETPVHGEHTH